MVSALFMSAKTSENLGVSSVNLRPPVALRSGPLNSGLFPPSYVGPLLSSWRGPLEMLLKCSVLRSPAFFLGGGRGLYLTHKMLKKRAFCAIYLALLSFCGCMAQIWDSNHLIQGLVHRIWRVSLETHVKQVRMFFGHEGLFHVNRHFPEF